MWVKYGIILSDSKTVLKQLNMIMMTQNHQKTASEMTEAYKSGYFYSEEKNSDVTDSYSGSIDKMVFKTGNPDFFQLVPIEHHILSVSLGGSKWISMSKPYPFTIRTADMKSIPQSIAHELKTDNGKLWIFKTKEEYENFMKEKNIPSIFSENKN